MTDPRALYNRIIMDHAQAPRHTDLPEPGTHEHLGHNPLCGDRVQLSARVSDQTVTAIGCKTRGCALAVAAASIMCELAHGAKVADLCALFDQLAAVVEGRSAPEAMDPDGPLRVFAPVADFPARHECVLLPWHTLIAALGPSRDPS